MWDLFRGGKGSSFRGSFIGSREGDLSKRSAFAMGMVKILPRCLWGFK